MTTKVAEKPILFSAPMVRAILDGRKTRKKIYAPRGVDPLSHEHIAKRILNGIAEINEHGCWIWGRSLSAGYGSMTIDGKAVRVHRMVIAIYRGVCERSLDEVCHNCPGGDNTRCVNPSHLFVGSHTDNVRDMVAKGRHGGPPPAMSGELNPAAKLTAIDVASIKAKLSSGLTQAFVASEFKISQQQVSNIWRGLRW